MSLRAAIITMMLSFLFAAPSAVLSYQKDSDIAIFDDLESKELPPPAYPSHEPFNGSISIESDTDFVPENGVSSGSGTQNDPYIIENLSFVVNDLPAIDVANIEKHLVIRNVDVTGGRSKGASSLRLTHCKNVMVSHADISGGDTGMEARGTKDVMVEHCCIQDCAIGALADDVTDLVLMNSTIERCDTIGCLFSGPSFNVSVLDNRVLSNQKDGMVFDGVFRGLNVTGNNVSGNGKDGMRCSNVDGNDVRMFRNVLSLNLGFGCSMMYCQTIWLAYNAFHDNPSGGILGEGLFGSSVNITKNTMTNNGIYGMELQGVQRINIIENIVSFHLNVGIYLGSGSCENHVVGNNIGNNGYGLLLGDGADVCNVLGNNISGNYIGCYVHRSSDIVFERNLFEQNVDFELMLDHVSGCSIAKNEIRTSNKGLVVSISDDIDMVSNRFYGEGSVLWLDRSCKVSVIDNAFNSTSMLLDQYSEVSWNLPERALGENIIGGPYRYGNYWANYHGEDIDGDGIGDTNLPHGPGDIGPLVKDHPPPDTEPPSVILTNNDVPATGESWTVTFRVHDNRSMFGVKLPRSSFIQYDIYGNVIHELTEEDVSYDDEGRFSRTIDVRPSAVSLSVNISAIDFSGNRVDTMFHLDVEDPIPPEVIGMDHPSEVEAGGELLIILDLYDNVRIGSVKASFDLGRTIAPLNASGTPMNDQATKWSVSIIVPAEALSVSIDIAAMDVAGNEVLVQITDITVIDTVPPLLLDRTCGPPRTGELFEMAFFVKDNHAVSSLVLLTSQDGLDGAPVWGPSPFNGYSWNVGVPVKATTKELSFTLKAEDRSGNERALTGKYAVIDTIPPTVRRLDSNVPMTGEPFELHLLTSDNWGTWSGTIEWHFDEARPSEMELPTEGRVVLQVPPNATMLHYHVRIMDRSFNPSELEGMVPVRDIIPPEVQLDHPYPKTSHTMTLRLTVSDNRGIKGVFFNHSFGDGRSFSEGLGPVSGDRYLQMDIPDVAWLVRMEVHAEDVSGLTFSIIRTVDIADGTAPTIEGHDLKKVGKDLYEISAAATDNRDLSRAWLVLKDDGGAEKRVTMEERGSGRYAIRMPSERLEGYRYYTIIVEDGSGLTASTGSIGLKVEGQAHNETLIIVALLTSMTLICLIIIGVLMISRQVRGSGRTYRQTGVWLSKGAEEMTRPREVVLPPEAFEE